MFPPSKKHLYRGMALPSVTGEELKINVAIDTSASIDDQLLENGMKKWKLKWIIAALSIVYVDAVVLSRTGWNLVAVCQDMNSSQIDFCRKGFIRI
ncbi:MAG: hypothetical protein IE889_03805 [Campylobacterales bacterium]|nr:hypothetical protein [Campylobacterales bacterium]